MSMKAVKTMPQVAPMFWAARTTIWVAWGRLPARPPPNGNTTCYHKDCRPALLAPHPVSGAGASIGQETTTAKELGLPTTQAL